MSDRIPGSSWSNPIWYGKWRIMIGDWTAYDFVHDDYDGDGDSRHGVGKSLDDCKAQIDEMEAEQ